MDRKMTDRELIETGETYLGLEFGSTRVKCVLIDKSGNILATGFHDWENKYVGKVWTYSQDEIIDALQSSYRELKKDVNRKFGIRLKKIKAMGVSAMMHGYLAFDKSMNLLVPFRTWRNTFTSFSSTTLSEEFDFPVPERWSVSHLHHAVINKEEHVSSIYKIMTLSSYVHYLLTGEILIGIGDASGMFPVNPESKDYDLKMLDKLGSVLKKEGFAREVKTLFPKILLAGERAGCLTKEGSILLDPDGDLEEGILFCPPEGDAGTGMVATNSVKKRSGNISAGTSVFLMAVLEKKLSHSYPGLIDIVMTPDGESCAMVHANNCTGDYDKWISLFGEVLALFDVNVSKKDLYGKVLNQALIADKDTGNLVSYNYISGESITKISEGAPLFMRLGNSGFTLKNFMRTQLFSALATIRVGVDILTEKEGVTLEKVIGHGGFFKDEEPGLMALSSALKTDVALLESAGEGGPWGMAILASYMVNRGEDTLSSYLDDKIFRFSKEKLYSPKKEDVESFEIFYLRYLDNLKVEKTVYEKK